MNTLDSFYVVPKQTFFYFGFTLPKKLTKHFVDFYDLKEGQLNKDIWITINKKKYPAKVRLVRIDNSGSFESRSDNKWKEREVIQVVYPKEYDTLKALRKLFIYSYASTIDGSKPKLKEVLEFIHIEDDQFRIKVIAKQETDFDDMFKFMEDKNLFKFWKEKDKKKSKNDRIILDHAKKWLPADKAKDYKSRNNVIYLLHHSKDDHLYVGKANNFGDRVQEGHGRVGLKKDWDKFMWFEINPEYNVFLEELEHFLIRAFASTLDNELNIEPVITSKIKLVNRQLKKNKI